MWQISQSVRRCQSVNLTPLFICDQVPGFKQLQSVGWYFTGIEAPLLPSPNSMSIP
jgi:hypothetical protein